MVSYGSPTIACFSEELPGGPACLEVLDQLKGMLMEGSWWQLLKGQTPVLYSRCT